MDWRSQNRTKVPTASGQIILAFLLALAVFVLLVALVPLGYQMNYAGKIFPGVSVAGVDLSGLTQAEAAARLMVNLKYPEVGKIVFQQGSDVWVAAPKQLGFYLDTQTSAQAALAYGRQGGYIEKFIHQLRAWSSGVDLPPLFLLDERAAQQYLQTIASQIDIPQIEASLGINGVDVVVRSGQVGRTLDVSAALQALREQVGTLKDGLIPLVVQESPPVILDASQQAEIAKRILNAPLVLKSPDTAKEGLGPWTIPPETIAEMLTIERVEAPDGTSYQVGLDMSAMRTFLEGIAPQFVQYPQNARFIFNDDTRQLELIQPAIIGRSLDIETSLSLIRDKLMAGEHSADLDLEYTNPAVMDDATAESLGITELVSSQTSYFYGSSSERIHNIETAASRFHGVLVPPGDVFSMASVLGDVSLDTGYAEALIIFGDRTIQGVGGGVCQVSTTLFRTVFFGGFPVVERYPHAYRVGYYEQTASGGIDSRLAGLDATVFVPVVDFKFRNDTPYWLLMETYVNPAARKLTWKFYSTSDGRTMTWDTTGLTNKVDPPDPLYEENPDLSEGEIHQVDWAAEGADITISRTVLRDGQEYFSDTYSTHYLPWRAVYQYGPGTDVPTPEPTPEP